MMIKKSTIVLIAISVAFWVALMTVVGVIASTGTPYHEKDIVITDASPTITKSTEKFSCLSLNSSGIVFSSDAKIKITQCDTISSPVIIYSEKIETLLKYSVIGDTLKISFPAIRNPKEQSTTWIKGGSPLSILTPIAPKNISMSGSYNPFQLVLENVKTDSISFKRNGNIVISGCCIDSLTLTYPQYYNEYYLKVNNSKIGVVNTRFNTSYPIQLYVSQDSASTSNIRNLEWSTENHKNELSLSRITVDKLSYKGNSISLNIKNNASVGQISSNE